ncbi:carbon storage regulator CsrA [Dermatophilus congolensis]|nr:carbon storage regulator CsrA [Dermatophilus congolensis]MBO3131331.1 carbon storage regulator CsrA [Dermatophilus congolensis]MBO3134513.1 carbon storage regulator CsrA [Dermatophilus congolensis]MBO3136750.1 carbon storage regulator CsrA [Dermatophilus congolensis]MBO3138993.1 carbon storage regulator CsrA [Dermatophilus congolensis]
MLVLSRRPQQSLLIGHDVVVTVLEVNGDTVRIGIKAPSDVDIHREEIYRDLQKANAAAEAKPGSAAELARRIHAGSKKKSEESSAAGEQTASHAEPGAQHQP